MSSAEVLDAEDREMRRLRSKAPIAAELYAEGLALLETVLDESLRRRIEEVHYEVSSALMWGSDLTEDQAKNVRRIYAEISKPDYGACATDGCGHRIEGHHHHSGCSHVGPKGRCSCRSFVLRAIK